MLMVYIYACIYIYTRIYIHIYVCVYVYACLYIFVCIYVCIYVHLYAFCLLVDVQRMSLQFARHGPSAVLLVLGPLNL